MREGPGSGCPILLASRASRVGGVCHPAKLKFGNFFSPRGGPPAKLLSSRPKRPRRGAQWRDLLFHRFAKIFPRRPVPSDRRRENPGSLGLRPMREEYCCTGVEGRGFSRAVNTQS
jgi:hypothetical protein